MRFSLIVATVGRNAELAELFQSLAAQTCQDFEVIIVDQNADDRLSWVETHGRFPFAVQRKRSSVQRVSHARNLGLAGATGEIVAFPDDDCIYPPDLLERVYQAFHDQPDLGVRTGPVGSPKGGFGSGRFLKVSGEINAYNVWLCSPAVTIFMRGEAVAAIDGFDEQIGVGARFGSGEDTDLVLRAVLAGWRGWYDIDQIAVHPDKALTPVATKRAFSYGAGFGYILRKHRAPFPVLLTFVVRPLGGCIVSLMRWRLMNAEYYWRTLQGRIYGFGSYRGAIRAG